jgi:pseudaminic acid cytidylyltransferase
MRIAIIPARGGSKRIPKKNVVDFLGQPMISYPIKAALESKLFDEIHVSTDDEEIAKVVCSLGFNTLFMRDQSIADDFAPVIDVARFVLKKYFELGKSFESFAMIMPCSPLLRAQDLVEAYKIFDQHGKKNPVLSVAKFSSPIEWAFQERDGILKLAEPEKLQLRSQDLRPAFFDTGTFSIQSSQTVLNSKTMSFEFLKYELPRLRAIDIDEPEDLETAKLLYKLSQIEG